MASQLSSQSQTIQILSNSPDSTRLWEPIAGTETKKLLDKMDLSQLSRETVEREAGAVLSHCVPPTQNEGCETVLVIGYVQSGKTLSFTTVSALAHDNGYQIIIVITGTKTNLLEQSAERMKKDLGSSHRDGWVHFENPSADVKTKSRIENTIESWKDADEDDKKTILIAVLKNHARLKKLIKLLKSINLARTPVLIIDDEADQASLNNSARQGRESTTYSRLTELKASIPRHSLLQYTATPQAPLLINIIDTLSPRYAEVLTPGEEYTGGKVFFEKNLDLVCVIPQSDVPSQNEPLNTPPDSLLAALRIFFIGATAGYLLKTQPDNRSMMIHPSQKRDPHHNYEKWVQKIVERWIKTLSKPDGDIDKQDLIGEFEASYLELSKTASDIPEFAQIIAKLKRTLLKTNVETLNTTQGPTPTVKWQQYYSHILIGGAALDRGFTVEGLTVTYMPRSLGVANADTIQQRARWFGYKSKYLGYCRIYLTGAARDAYESYVAHEEDIRGQLRKHKSTGAPLTTWRRAFFLDSSLRPTRQSVIQLELIRGSYSNEWYYPRAPHSSPQMVAENRQLVEQFLQGLSLKKHSESEHLIDEGVGLETVYRKLLTLYKVPDSQDNPRFIGLLMQIRNYIDTVGDERCTVVDIKRTRKQPTYRTLNTSGRIEQLFPGGSQASRDRDIHLPNGLTVQIHHFDELWNSNKTVVVARDVPVLGIWVPQKMSKDWISQEVA